MISFRWFTLLTKTTRHLSDNNRYFCLSRKHISILMADRKLSGNKKTMVGTKTTEAGSSSKKGETKKEEFEFFFGNSFVFSQFHPAKFTVEGITYNCMEQYMHHQKAVTFKDSVRENAIMRTADPKEQKKLGRKVLPFDKVVWGRKCVAVVTKGSLAKYRQNSEMKKALFATYPKTLVEASPRDRLWGIGLGRNNEKAKNRATWRGKNLLGETLTEVRNKMMLEEGAVPVSEQKAKSNPQEKCPPAKEGNERQGKQKSPAKDEDKHSSLKEKKDRPEEVKTPSKDKGRHSSSKEKEGSEEVRTPSKDKKRHSSSKEKKDRPREVNTPSKDKERHSSSKEKKDRSGEVKTPSKDKERHLSSKEKKDRSMEVKTPPRDKERHSSSKEKKDRSMEVKTPPRDKERHSSSKEKKDRSVEVKTPSKDKERHSSSKEKQERSVEGKTLSKDKIEHSSSKERSEDQETSFEDEVKRLSSKTLDRNGSAIKEDNLAPDSTSSNPINTHKNEQQRQDISVTFEKMETEYDDHTASEERRELVDSREILPKVDTSLTETNESISCTDKITPPEDLMTANITMDSSDCRKINFSEYALPVEETNVRKMNVSESTLPTKDHSLSSRKRQWLPSEVKSENDIQPQPLKKIKLSTDDSKQPTITQFTIPDKDKM